MTIVVRELQVDVNQKDTVTTMEFRHGRTRCLRGLWRRLSPVSLSLDCRGAIAVVWN